MKKIDCNYSKKLSAFTLIELLVVIAIIAMLLAILMPSLKRVKEKGLTLMCQSQMRQIGFALRTYAEDNENEFLMHQWSGDPSNPYPVPYPSGYWFGRISPYIDTRAATHHTTEPLAKPRETVLR